MRERKIQTETNSNTKLSKLEFDENKWELCARDKIKLQFERNGVDCFQKQQNTHINLNGIEMKREFLRKFVMRPHCEFTFVKLLRFKCFVDSLLLLLLLLPLLLLLLLLLTRTTSKFNFFTSSACAFTCQVHLYHFPLLFIIQSQQPKARCLFLKKMIDSSVCNVHAVCVCVP